MSKETFNRTSAVGAKSSARSLFIRNNDPPEKSIRWSDQGYRSAGTGSLPGADIACLFWKYCREFRKSHGIVGNVANVEKKFATTPAIGIASMHLGKLVASLVIYSWR
jgi:hypothetical protein